MNKRLLECLRHQTFPSLLAFQSPHAFEEKIVTLRQANLQVFTELALWRMPSATDYHSTTDIQQMNELPKDPMMLFSTLNMKLRDHYASLDLLCEDLHLDEDEIRQTMADHGFEYSAEHNKFW